jgi:hypothetical protein
MNIDLPDGRRVQLLVHHHVPKHEEGQHGFVIPLHDLPSTADGNVPSILVNGYTVAEFTDNEKTYVHTAYCSHMDQFKRHTGVKVAVQRAIAHLPREERAAIWDKVWNLSRRKVRNRHKKVEAPVYAPKNLRAEEENLDLLENLARNPQTQPIVQAVISMGKKLLDKLNSKK